MGKSAFITGGANGIGKSLARILAAEGYGVSIVDIDTVASEELVSLQTHLLSVAYDQTLTLLHQLPL